jgi:hypothetical protein
MPICIAPRNSFQLLSYVAGLINSPHITTTVGMEKIQVKSLRDN